MPKFKELHAKFWKSQETFLEQYRLVMASAVSGQGFSLQEFLWWGIFTVQVSLHQKARDPIYFRLMKQSLKLFWGNKTMSLNIAVIYKE